MARRLHWHRLWGVLRRLFRQAADFIKRIHPSAAEKLRQASPHWMRPPHATHALARGAELTTVRDNLRHASISTASIYLHGDKVKRARPAYIEVRRSFCFGCMLWGEIRSMIRLTIDRSGCRHRYR
ncbi:protein of unknown function [Cupriavidus neocaledonicus]|uniref:Uncharacterized protein n=1 Tax=Cupriavidus neocaledonicus TaxID=1040979 RepID=A0A375H910_9BURK|nr:protein of unknown function [Cupriavidus neocaledonicus]